MDVRCERCNTEYEFDDALVSGRGTTVKCTNCGHKFKIRRKDGDFSEDFWNVQTGDGRTLVFTSLRELQRAIQTNLVDRNDLLSRGGLKQKAIGQIPELAPFFDQRDAPKRSAPPAIAPAPAPVEPTSPLPAPRQRMSTRPDFPPPPPERSELPPAASLAPGAQVAQNTAKTIGTKTLLGTGHLPASEGKPIAAVAQRVAQRVEQDAPPSSFPTAVLHRAPPIEMAASDPPSTEPEREPDTQRYDRDRERERESERGLSAPPPAAGNAAKPGTRTQPIDPIYLPKHTPPPPQFEASSPLPLPTSPVLRSMNLDDEYPSGARHTPSLPDGPGSFGKRRPVGGYIIAVVVLGGMALVGALWAKDHLGSILGTPKAPVAVADPRVAGLLAAGEKALADGNTELAKESFDKASALAEKDPRVLLDIARLAGARADVPWLKTRLLGTDASAADDARLTKDELAERSAAARQAAGDALAVAPDDPAAMRAKIDALRISGDRDGARALVARVAPSAAQPETAYVLAALDLSESEPLWSTVIERLKIATSAESGPGRARAALAYALVRSGDVAGAKAEVDRLATMSKPHPLLPLLRAFVDHAKPSTAPAGAATSGDDAGTISAMALPDAGRVRGEGKASLPTDARQLVAQAEKARARGDLDRAQSLFAAAIDRNPNDTEALNGLASIAHSRHDLNGARASYKRVLSINPSYVPALVGVGDVDWESGDRASAMKTYKEIVERFPEGSYPARVKSRADGASGGSGSGATSGGTSGSGATTPAPTDTGGGG
jgi:predicted Zn finger-like uncharacterized protein